MHDTYPCPLVRFRFEEKRRGAGNGLMYISLPHISCNIYFIFLAGLPRKGIIFWVGVLERHT